MLIKQNQLHTQPQVTTVLPYYANQTNSVTYTTTSHYCITLLTVTFPMSHFANIDKPSSHVFFSSKSLRPTLWIALL